MVFELKRHQLFSYLLLSQPGSFLSELFFFLKSTCCFLTTGYFHNYFQLLLSITDENQSTCYFRLVLLLSVCKKHCGLLDVASWLTSCSYHHFKLIVEFFEHGRVTDVVHTIFCVEIQVSVFASFRDLPPLTGERAKFQKGYARKRCIKD